MSLTWALSTWKAAIVIGIDLIDSIAVAVHQRTRKTLRVLVSLDGRTIAMNALAA
jgi:hypothetical protein